MYSLITYMYVLNISVNKHLQLFRKCYIYTKPIFLYKLLLMKVGINFKRKLHVCRIAITSKKLN